MNYDELLELHASLATERQAREKAEQQLKRGKAHGTEAVLGKCPKCDNWTVALDMMACLKCTWSASEAIARAESAEAKLKVCRVALDGVLNSALHPDMALRAIMVDLKPVREALEQIDKV